MTTATTTAPHAYPIAGVRGVTIACHDDGARCAWVLRCPHGGHAVLRTPKPADDAAAYNALVGLVARWRERQAAGFRMQHGCDCGETG